LLSSESMFYVKEFQSVCSDLLFVFKNWYNLIQRQQVAVSHKTNLSFNLQFSQLLSTQEEKTQGIYIKARWVLAMMGFLATFNVHSLRNNFSVAIIAMVNISETVVTESHQSNICPDKTQKSSTAISVSKCFYCFSEGRLLFVKISCFEVLADLLRLCVERYTITCVAAFRNENCCLVDSLGTR